MSNILIICTDHVVILFTTYTLLPLWKQLPSSLTEDHNKWWLFFVMLRAPTGSNSNSSEKSHTIIVIPPTVTHQHLISQCDNKLMS